MKDIDGGLHPAVDGQSLDETRRDSEDAETTRKRKPLKDSRQLPSSNRPQTWQDHHSEKNAEVETCGRKNPLTSSSV